MRNIVKKVLVCVVTAFSIQLLVGGKFVFAETTNGQANSENSVQQTTNSSSANEINQLSEKTGVYLGKIWTISLSKPVDASSVNTDTIKVVEKATNAAVGINLHVQSGDQSKINIIPNNNYKPSTEYSVIISKNLKSQDGSNLKSDVTMDFKTQDLPTSADDTNTTAMQFDNYTLPDQVTAKFPDGTTKQWDVEWNNANVDTSIVGTYTFTGQLEGTNVNVNLNLNVTPYQITSASNGTRNQSAIQISHLNYLMASKANRDSVEQTAIQLHGGDASNTCVYFASESYRRVGFSIPTWVCNTSQLIPQFLNNGWKKDYNKDDLISGDQCFTKNDGTGYPTHTYTFIKWVDDNDHSWAYIVDNQGMGLNGDEYHKRDILLVDTDQFDKFQFFMYKPN